MYKLVIPDWHPARLNEFLGRHWSVGARLKRRDRELVCLLAREQIPDAIPALGKRRVSLVITLAPRQRAGDPDAYFKSLLDSLVHADLLVDDNRQGVTLGSVEFRRGASMATEIVLEDVE